VRIYTIEDAYQFAIKVEERLNKIFESKQKGIGLGHMGIKVKAKIRKTRIMRTIAAKKI
jgi:hypothetical protein